ncbi:MAG: Lnb N-terminal periplasmic domain-containing protein [Candidatus Binatia bacterium]
MIAGATLWGAGMLYFSPLLPEAWRSYGSGAFALLTLLAFIFLPRRGRTAVAALAVIGVLVVLFLRIPASNVRDWQPDVANLPYATINGDLITIHNVRNFDYRTETDFTPRWETRTYNLSKLDSADVIAVYWAGKAIAHVMVSFGFAGKDYLSVSIETRKEKDESYSTLAGFFRQYELYYVVADERDVVGVRTTYRQPQEDVYIYRARGPLQNVRRIFLDYIKSINELRERPSYYNTLTTNCTTSILFHTRMNPESPPMSWKVLLSGYVPDYLYDLGRIDTSRPFAELEKLSHVNARAHAAGRDATFSQRIRQGLPMPAPFHGEVTKGN